MNSPNIFDEHLHSPFFIFMKRAPRLADEQILNHFGLDAYQPTDELIQASTYIVLADLGEWTMLADDWLYQLWHMKSTKLAIASLARDRYIFAWSVGDCDESYDFCLYRNGQLIRQLTVDSPNFSDQVVRIDFGKQIPREAELLATDLSIDKKLHRLCAELGINSMVTQNQLRLYFKPYVRSLSLAGAITNL